MRRFDSCRAHHLPKKAAQRAAFLPARFLVDPGETRLISVKSRCGRFQPSGGGLGALHFYPQDVILGRRTRAMTEQLGAMTMPEFLEARYGSKALKIVSAIIIFVFLIPYTAAATPVCPSFSKAFSGSNMSMPCLAWRR